MDWPEYPNGIGWIASKPHHRLKLLMDIGNSTARLLHKIGNEWAIHMAFVVNIMTDHQAIAEKGNFTVPVHIQQAFASEERNGLS